MDLEIGVNAPISYIWIVAFPQKIPGGIHPLPNTEIYPWQQNLKTMAEIHHNRDVILYYFGNNLSFEQIDDMDGLCNLNSNIVVKNFFSLDWQEYDFSFLYNNETTTLLKFLKMDNEDNLLGLRKDIAEHLLLLHHQNGVIFLDFDNKIYEPIYEPLPTNIGILCGWDYDMNNRFDFFVNNAMVVSGPKNSYLVDCFKELQNYLMLNGIDTDGCNDPFILTSEHIKFKNLHNFTGEWKLVFLMCDLQCCSIVSALCEKFGIDAFEKELIHKAEPTTAFKRVLASKGNYLSIESDESRTWRIDNKYKTVFNNMYNVPYIPLKTEYRATINFNKVNQKPLNIHVIIDSKLKFNMITEFIKLNPNRNILFYTFEWIVIPKHFKHDVIVLKDYIFTPSTYRLAMVNILHQYGGICWSMQHNPISIPSIFDEREIACLKGCDGKLCGCHICFDIFGVDRPKHKIFCEVKEILDTYKKYMVNVTLNQHLYFDTHSNYVEYTFSSGRQLYEKLIDIALWYSISGYTHKVRNYHKIITFNDLILDTKEYALC